MRIDFYCGPSHETWSPKSIESGIGGSEEMTIYLAEELAKLENEVYVWNRCLDDEGEYNGVSYRNYDDFDIKKTDILIVWRDPKLLLSLNLDKVVSKKYLWLHDTVSQIEIIPYLLGFDGIFVLSKWHKSFYEGVTTPELRFKYIQTRNAVKMLDIKNIDRDKYTIVYGSLYNRGLLELLSVWPKIKSEVPEAKLRIFYGWQTLEKIMPSEDFKKFKEMIEFQMDQDGITHLGRISHEEVAKEMKSASIWAYPCINFNEVSCITAMKAQIYGAIPVIIPRAALNETVKYGMKFGKAESSDELLSKWSDCLIKVLKDSKGQEAMRQLMMRNTPDKFNYKELAKQWMKEFNG